MPGWRWHDLRHSYATLLLEAGEELAVISTTLGHAQIATTADVYSHLSHRCCRGPQIGSTDFSMEDAQIPGQEVVPMVVPTGPVATNPGPFERK